MSDNPAYRLTDHARQEAERRRIPLAVIETIMATPGQIVPGSRNRQIYQSQVEINGKLYLVRLITDPTDPPTVVTVYRTSKIEKYWREDDA